MPSPLPAPVVAAAQRNLRRRGTAGVSIAVFDADGLVAAGGVGLARRSDAMPATARTEYRVASISKLLTTTTVLTLAGRGLIDLDRPANDHLPADLRFRDADGAPSEASVRSLLSHTSGLGAGVRGVEVGGSVVNIVSNGGRVHTLDDAVRGLRATYRPGERVVYSNPAFNVLGAIAAHVTGRSFEDAARELVLEPLGMAASRFTPRPTGPRVADNYGSLIPPGVGRRPATALRLVATPMGGLTTSVEDLARFGRVLLDPTSATGLPDVAPELWADATTRRATNHAALDQGFGLGFKVRGWRGRTVVGHDGNMPGVATQYVVSPSDGVGVAVLTNGFALAVPHELANRTLEWVLGLDPEDEAGAPRRPEPPALDEWVALARSVAGRYRVCDISPPGPIGVVNDVTTRATLVHDAGGRLLLSGHPGSDGPTWLVPDGDLGHYRVASGVDPGTSAVIEERDDGWHLWFGFTNHLWRPRRRRPSLRTGPTATGPGRLR